MEWVETTGKTVEDAKNQALDQLGVAEEDAEFDILDEPRAGLFGRVRGEARVRARVRPSTPRPKLDRRDRKKREASGVGSDSVPGATVGTEPSESTGAKTPANRPERRPKAAGDSESANGQRRSGTASRKNAAAEAGSTTDVQPASKRSTEIRESNVDAAQVGEEARTFVQGLVDAFGLVGNASVRREDDDIEVAVDGADLGLLVGPRGVTLQAVQELTRVAAQRRLGDHETRLRVDVGGYRVRRREALAKFAEQVATQVVTDGTPKRLEPMSSSDRKVIHDVLSGFDGVVTHSEGDDPRRCVVIAPANA
jgi:spoIIIJ-associated protein